MTGHFERHVPADNMARFYRLEIQPTLFGDWSLRRSWGRIGTFGRARVERFATAEAALAAARRLAEAKCRRGYVRLPERLDLPFGRGA
ncbi:WGR domain-containing protein [Antarcticimicrobium luteum]|uniref:WGR domain-containing protein n=1 Tax=Antarcticimicrobium luteum TaxID=2547397 RepID=A0A4R5V1W6_9RHOB|nr:WGR domain-containing protein [Antarcticimicrobium luteum]TDK45724.1 WGR domain-containing protein [Antarcticimicrobium luteum]